MRVLHTAAVLIFMLLIISLSGCGSRSIPDGNTFTVYIRNDTGADIYAVQLDYALGEATLGTVVGGYADNSPIKPGDSLDFQFLPQDFPAGADLSQLSLKIQPLDQSGNASAPEIFASVSAAYGRIYEIPLTGSHIQPIP